MKINLCLVALLVTAASAICRPVSVELKPTEVVIESDLAPITVRFDARSHTNYGPVGCDSSGSLVDAAGTSGEPGLMFKFGEEKLRLAVTAEVVSEVVNIHAKWDTKSNPAGVWWQSVCIPAAIAQDMIVEINEQPALSSADPEIAKKPPSLLDVSKITFKQASTGKVLFEISGTFPRISINSKENSGEDVRIGLEATPDWSHGNLLDLPESNWQIVFP